MKKLLSILWMCIFASVLAFGQSMSDAEILRFAMQQKKAGASETEIAQQLLQKGATPQQIQQLRQKYSKQLSETGMAGQVDNAIDKADKRLRKNNAPTDAARRDNRRSRAELEQRGLGYGTGYDGQLTYPTPWGMVPPGLTQDEYYAYIDSIRPQGKKVFGRDIFNNKELTFEPQMNIATPQNYVLGPGDEVVIDVYGASQESMALTVSADGDITVPDYGPIHVSGLTVAGAQSRIRSRLGDYYASSEIKMTVGQTRTIMVNVMGEVKVPGTYTVSAFATVFHALYRAGGVSDLGTLRNIKVFRQGKQISVVDIYEFILNGRLAGNVRLQDNDVIQVGTYECIVDVAGKVKRPMAYEMRKTESVGTLLRYSGSFTGDAYKKSVRLFRKSGRMKSVHNIEEFELADFKVDDGDSLFVDSIIDRFENTVEVKGAVFRAGMYQLGDKVNSVRSLIESADGVTEEALTTRAVLRRMKANRTQEVLSLDLGAILNGTQADVPLQNEDVLFVPTLTEHQNLRTLTIEGEVIFPGMYEYADGMTVEDLILQSGGLTDAASTAKVDVSRRIRDVDANEGTMELSKNFSFTISEDFRLNTDSPFYLEPYDVVEVRRSPVFTEAETVNIEGEVTFQGPYTLSTKAQHLSDLVKAAGGVLPGAYVRGARLERQMSDAEIARRDAVIRMAKQTASGKDSLDLDKLSLETTYTVGIHLDEALANPGSVADIELQAGDRLVVPRYNRTVKISGDVLAPNTVGFTDGKKYKYYVEQAGGFGDRARKRHAYIVYQNGTMALARKGKIEPGCEVIVPTKTPRDASNLTQWLSIGTSAASLATMFASVANLLK